MKHRTLIFGGSAAAVTAAAAWLVIPADPATPPIAPAAQRTKPTGYIALTGAQVRSLGLEVAPVDAADTIALATLPAQITPPPNARVAVAAQLPGVITRIFVVNGQAVTKGQALATVASRDVVSLSADLARARSRQAVASAQAGRLQQLSREGIIAPARSDEASALAAQSAIDVSEQHRLIALLGGGRIAGAGYTLTTPISGRISSMTAETGKMVDPAMAPFVIDGAGALQVAAQVPERLIGLVRPGMQVRVGSDGVGTVLAVGAAVDPTTRSATLTANVQSAPGISPGSATSVVIEGPAPAGAVRVPAAAVTQIDGRTVVFLVVRGGVSVRPVVISEGTGDHVVVTRGLTLGQRVVTSGISELVTLASAN
ncbi:efflux RND transporter periplasmic adaptor subunit [Sphingomonas radiodurans]|uniref:efflux RND transporter periplasmic adaptor subunit n=1 Tax=Sphingomonas radiodurans TaxID=2890321 RepID=UPI001E5C88CA|nr:efflux RND transporter periplasmic adaptor subunit [Sphingomonas radiodurans]WBH18041.1 efflux RND transporter periplasmic adaptor subunit [Sphingomonas radiodurans]